MKSIDKIKFENHKVKEIFKNYDKDYSEKLLLLRQLLLDTAKETEGVGEIEETLKWNEPSYVTNNPKTGSTIRIKGEY